MSFLIILAVVPVLVAAMSVAAEQDSGILKIALVQENEDDKVSSAVVDKLTGEKSIISYEICATAAEAHAAVEGGAADGAWIFPGNMQMKVDEYIAGRAKKGPLVTVIEREDNVFLQLAREKLFGALYSHLSYSLYSDFIINDLSDGEKVSERELEENYSIMEVDGDFISFSFMDGVSSGDTADNANYLVTPIRGLLALMIMLCGLASVMYFMQDEEAGNYVWLPAGAKLPFSYGYYMIAIVDMAVIVCIALSFAGVFTSWQRELPLMLLYCVSTAGFCEIIRNICRKTDTLGIAIPILMIMMLVLCPVFLNVRKVRALQYLLPPFYYLHAVNSNDYMAMMVVYTIVLYAVGFLLHRIRRKRA